MHIHPAQRESVLSHEMSNIRYKYLAYLTTCTQLYWHETSDKTSERTVFIKCWVCNLTLRQREFRCSFNAVMYIFYDKQQ